MHLDQLPRWVGQCDTPQSRGLGLDFLWLELTNRCNLRCVHCYTDSHPHSGYRDLLTEADYVSVMLQAYELGCRKLQFIGGEPQLNPHFYELMIRAKEIGFSSLEVFSNLTRLDNKTLRFAADNKVCFATSVYSNEPAAHDAITQTPSSHIRTIANLRKLIDAGVETRAALIVIDQDETAVDRTIRFLGDLGVGHIQHDGLRRFGRADPGINRSADLTDLCGHCWAGKLSVAPNGEAYPCVMARNWSVGNVLQLPLADIVAGRALAAIRQTIFDEVWQTKIAACSPSDDCAPAASIPGGAPSKPSEDPHCPPSQCGSPGSEGCLPMDIRCAPDGDCIPTQGCSPAYGRVLRQPR